MVIWRGSGWLILPFFLLTWWIASGVVEPIYRSVTGFEYMYNADKAMCWTIALVVGAVLILLFNLFALPFFDGLGRSLRQGNVQPAAAPQDAPAAASAPVTPVRYKSHSSFFFIPMRFFPFIFLGIAVLVFAANISTAIAEASHG